MNVEEILQTIYSTTKRDKVLSCFYELPFSEKQAFLKSKKGKQKILKVADLDFLFRLLIYLPYQTRINFLDSIPLDNYSEEYEKVLIQFLRLKNYNDFDTSQLFLFPNIKEKPLIMMMFRTFSKEKLKSILVSDICQYMNDYAFTEISKKENELLLDTTYISNIHDSIFIKELKKRAKYHQKTEIDIDYFISLNTYKQNLLLSNHILSFPKQELIQAIAKKNAKKKEEELTLLFDQNISSLNSVKMLEIQWIICQLEEKKAKLLIQKFFIEVFHISELTDQSIQSLFYLFQQLEDSTDLLMKLIEMKPFSIIYCLNTGKIREDLDRDFDQNLTILQYQQISRRKMNQIFRLLGKTNQKSDDIEKLDSSLLVLGYQLYLIFGYEITVEILQGKFGLVDIRTLQNLLWKCDTKKVKLKEYISSYEPILQEDFIQFMIGDKKNPQSTIRKILRGELDDLKNNFSYFYNHFDRIQMLIGNKIHLHQLLPLLQKKPFLLLPDEYKLTNDLLDMIICSYRTQDADGNIIGPEIDNEKIVQETCNFYHQSIEKRVTSSIPRVWGSTEEDYSYEVLRLDDPMIMTVGYQTGCCFRLNGLSKDFLRYCSESVYARVIVIRNDYKEICSMIPIIRNGNVLLGNSIESNRKGDSHKIYHALQKAYEDILSISNEWEEDPIIGCFVTNLHHNCYSNKVLSHSIYPISEQSFYTNYEYTPHLVAANGNIEEKDIQLYAPEAIYYDERPEIYSYDCYKDENYDEMKERIKAIQFKNHKPLDTFFYPRYLLCSEDWYLGIAFRSIVGECLTKDPRAIEEYLFYRNYLEENVPWKEIHLPENTVPQGPVYIKK